MRILVAMPPFEVFSPTTGGAVSTVAEGLGRWWAAAGHDVHVTTPPADRLHSGLHLVEVDFPRRSGRLRPTRVAAKLEGELRGFDWPAYRLYVREISRAIRSVRPHRLVVHNDLVLPALRLPIEPSRIVVHLHNQVSVKRGPRAARVLETVGATVAVSDFIAADARERFGASDVITLHNGVDTGTFSVARTAREPGVPLRVAFLGRLLLAKGPHVVVDAVRRLAGHGLRVDLTVIGSPSFHRSERHALDDYVQRVRHGLEQVGGVYVPHLDRAEVALELARQDVVVVPSLFPDPFPLVVYEAMAAGCAVVASSTGGLPESVSGAGLLFPAGDAEALAAHLRTLATDPALLRRCVDAGRARAEAQDWSAVARQWWPVLETTADGGRTRDARGPVARDEQAEDR